MNDLILTPSFSDWLLDLISGWINLFDEKADDEDRGDVHEEDDAEEENATGNKDQKDDEEDPKEDEEEDGEEGDDDDAEETKAHMIPKSRYDSAATRAIQLKNVMLNWNRKMHHFVLLLLKIPPLLILILN